MILDELNIRYNNEVPTWYIKGNKRVKIEIDDITATFNLDNMSRIYVTCFDFQLEETLKRYEKRNPVIIKEW